MPVKWQNGFMDRAKIQAIGLLLVSVTISFWHGNFSSAAEPVKLNANASTNELTARDDSANKADTVKSWTSSLPPGKNDNSFLNVLDWKDHKVGSYVLRTGKIYGRWVAAMQWMQNKQLVMTEYTPPYEYVTVIDPVTGKKLSNDRIVATDSNKDGVLEIAFLHEKLNDPNYHMYTVYALPKEAPPKLLWKSGGKFGDWRNQVEHPATEIWSNRGPHK